MNKGKHHGNMVISLNDRQSMSRQRKQELLQRLRIKQRTLGITGQEVHPAEPEFTSNGDDQTSTSKSLKKRIAELERFVEQLKVKKEASVKEVSAYRQEIAALKRERFSLQQSLALQQAVGKRLEEEVEGLQLTLQSKEEGLQRLSATTLLRQIASLEKEKRRLINVNSSLRDQITHLQNENKHLKNRIQLDESIRVHSLQAHNKHLQDVNHNLNRELSSFKTKVADLEEQLRVLEEAEDVEQLIEMLGSRLSTDTVLLYEGLFALLERVKAMKRRSRKKTQPIRDRNSRAIGILMKQDDQIVFMGIEGLTFQIATSLKPLIVDAPAAAYIDEEGAAHIVEVFDEERVISNAGNVGKRKLLQGKSTRRNNSFSLGGLKLLVVGSRNMTEYRDALEAAGALVELFNPYEESPELLKGAFGRANIILICARHVPHLIYDLIDPIAENIEVIHRDRVTVILARARYLAVKLGLVTNGIDHEFQKK